MTFEIKAYPEIWQSLDMDVERFDKARLNPEITGALSAALHGAVKQ